MIPKFLINLFHVILKLSCAKILVGKDAHRPLTHPYLDVASIVQTLLPRQIQMSNVMQCDNLGREFFIFCPR